MAAEEACAAITINKNNYAASAFFNGPDRAGVFNSQHWALQHNAQITRRLQSAVNFSYGLLNIFFCIYIKFSMHTINIAWDMSTVVIKTHFIEAPNFSLFFSSTQWKYNNTYSCNILTNTRTWEMRANLPVLNK